MVCCGCLCFWGGCILLFWGCVMVAMVWVFLVFDCVDLVVIVGLRDWREQLVLRWFDCFSVCC